MNFHKVATYLSIYATNKPFSSKICPLNSISLIIIIIILLVILRYNFRQIKILHIFYFCRSPYIKYQIDREDKKRNQREMFTADILTFHIYYKYLGVASLQSLVPSIWIPTRNLETCRP
jgi:hypothetical protein